jgi:hypothetical protein
MKNETFDGKIESAYGYPLSKLKILLADGTTETAPAVLPYDGTISKFENMDEVRSANEVPKDSELVAMINAKNLAKAVAAARQKALDDYGVQKPTLKDDDQLRLKKFYELLIASDTAHDEAVTMSESMAKAKWVTPPTAPTV